MNQIKTGAVLSYVGIFLSVLTGLLYTPWMVNTIGKGNYGLYTLAMSVISLFVFDFGLGNAVTRFVSKYLAENRQDMVDKLIGLVFKIYLIVDAVICLSLIVIYFLLPVMYKGLTPEELETFKQLYIIVSFYSVISFPFIPLGGIITSYEKFIQLKSVGIIHQLIVVITMTCCLLLGGGVFALVMVNSLAGIVTILLKLWILGGKRIKAIDWRFWDKPLLKSVLSFSIWVTVIQLAQRCIFNIAPSIAAAFADSSAITILGIAICLEGYTYTFASGINGMFLPKVSRMVAGDNKDAILNLMTRVGRIQIYIIGLICVGFVVTGREFIQAWMGDGFELVYPCALMIILPSFLQLPQEIGSTTIVAEGKVKYQAFAFIFMAVLNLALAFPFTKMWGIVGLCASIMIAYFARTFALDVIFYKQLRLNVFKFFKDAFLKTLPSILLPLVLSMLINSQIVLGGWIGFIVKAGICVTLYCVSVYFLSMNAEEKALVVAPIRKILKR